ncbi:hypothetical protein HY570_03195 [Candidatus Micrarchaeota archaeon]|nr:hypothetical protein [Candidatus Micrarchaeota archaeon]
MSDASEVRFVKEEKGPLDKFKNEKLIKSKFGDIGVELYRKVEEDKNADELLNELGIDEAKFVEILEFLESNNMIKILSSEEAVVPPTIEAAPEIAPAEETPEAEEEAPEIKEEVPEISGTEVPKPIIEPKKPKQQLSSLEKMINERFGDIGLQVYSLIDGERTAEEILNQTGISEVELVEILEFMDKEGIIRLEKPVEEQEIPPQDMAPPVEEGFEKIEAGEFEPIIEERPKQSALEEEESPDIIPIDLPVPQKTDFLNKIMFKVRLILKFGKFGPALYNKIDGKKTVIELVNETNISFSQMDLILLYAGQANMLYFKTLTKQDIKSMYGEDGLRIYNKFGRDGVLVYSLIGKEASLKDIVYASKLNPEMVVEIFMFIHNILEIGLPLSKDILFKQLGLTAVYSS